MPSGPPARGASGPPGSRRVRKARPSVGGARDRLASQSPFGARSSARAGGVGDQPRRPAERAGGVARLGVVERLVREDVQGIWLVDATRDVVLGERRERPDELEERPPRGAARRADEPDGDADGGGLAQLQRHRLGPVLQVDRPRAEDRRTGGHRRLDEVIGGVGVVIGQAVLPGAEDQVVTRAERGEGEAAGGVGGRRPLEPA